jgi:hypothetical protein
MKIDAATGSFTICQTVFPADLTLTAFRASPAYQGRSKILESPTFVTYKLDVTCAGKSYLLTLYFKSDALAWVTIYISDPRGSSSWDDWSEAAEQQKLQSLVSMLAAQGIASGQKFAWGTVEATYDPRAGASSITVRYSFQ